MNRPFAALAAATLLTVAAGCGTDAAPSGTPSSAGASSSAPAATTLTVFAAASLKTTFTTLGKQFETAHPGTTVTFNFAGSADLVTQLQQGAPADVFASADTKNMDKATADKLVQGAPVTFASNTLEIAVPPDNPAKVASLQDLAKSGVKVVVCAPEVPCGAATQKIETATGVDIKPVSEESAVTDVLNKVQTGEADAGLVYVTDVKSAGDKVKGVTFPESSKAVNEYPIAPLAASKNADLAKQFAELVTGADGQKVLADAGFAKPLTGSNGFEPEAQGPLRRTPGRGGLYSGLPGWVFVPAVLGVLFVVLPLAAMASRVEWSRFFALVTSESSRAALLLSLRTSSASTVLCIMLGVPMALVLARTSFPGQRIVRSLMLLPLVLPPVVGGIALLYTFGRRGLLGHTLEVLGIQIAFSTTAVVLAQAFVALPFLVVSLEGTLRTVGQRYEIVAATLGARPTTVLVRVGLPLVLPGLLSGAVLSFARSLGEFGATLTFAGSLQGVTRTLPLEIYLQRETDADAAVALSLVLVVIAVLVVGLAQGRGASR